MSINTVKFRYYSYVSLTVAGDDYVVGPYRVQFNTLGIFIPAQLCTDINTIDDLDVEGPHTFTLEIIDVTLPNIVSIESPLQQIATINDNDRMCILFYS